ncbi:MAG TPA: enoyl-CoA hydratase [Rhodospirillaceae bacterium]|nr:enoyl-CoA hydratase [Rhodospirillaceae bacterium]
MPHSALESTVLLASDQAGVRTLTLNRPQARNALSLNLMQTLTEALVMAGADPGVKVVVLAAAGPVFCAGHDLKEMRSDPRQQAYQAVFSRCASLMKTIVRLPKPVIAKVHAMATAAGCQLVASCDLAVAADLASFATPGVNIGLFCSTPMVALSRVVGRKAAMDMLLTGRSVAADEALRMGLVNRVVPANQLDEVVTSMAEALAGKSSLTLAIGKEAFYRQLEMDLDAAYAYAGEVMTNNMMAADAAEGIDAFLGKRSPVWRGC